MFQFCVVRSDPAAHFTTGLATNAQESENLAAPPALGSGSARGSLSMLTIVSVENLAWDLLVFAKDTFQTGAIATDSFLGRWSFVATDAVRVAGTGLYYYHINGLDVPIRDEDGTAEIHLMLVNRSAASKTAGAGGAVRVDLTIRILP